MLCREALRKYLSPALFFVFNVTFISLAQSFLLFLITTPTYVMLLAAPLGETMSTADVIFARVLMGLVLVEVFADQQQWSKSPPKSTFQSLTICVLQIFRKPKGFIRRLPKCPTNSNRTILTVDSLSQASGHGAATLILLQSSQSGLFYINGVAGLHRCYTTGPSWEPCHTSYFFRLRHGSLSSSLQRSMKTIKNTRGELANFYQSWYQTSQETSATKRQSRK